VTNVRFAPWNGRGREGDGADRKPVERSKSRVGHGGTSVARCVHMERSIELSLRPAAAALLRNCHNNWLVFVTATHFLNLMSAEVGSRMPSANAKELQGIPSSKHNGFGWWLRSAVGEREKWSGERREACSETQPERNARRRSANGSLPRLRHCANARS